MTTHFLPAPGSLPGDPLRLLVATAALVTALLVALVVVAGAVGGVAQVGTPNPRPQAAPAAPAPAGR